MPSKKSSHTHGADKDGKSSQRPSSPLFKEGCDPLDTVVSIVEKRARNLSKRKVLVVKIHVHDLNVVDFIL